MSGDATVDHLAVVLVRVPAWEGAQQGGVEQAGRLPFGYQGASLAPPKSPLMCPAKLICYWGVWDVFGFSSEKVGSRSKWKVFYSCFFPKRLRISTCRSHP